MIVRIAKDEIKPEDNNEQITANISYLLGCSPTEMGELPEIKNKNIFRNISSQISILAASTLLMSTTSYCIESPYHDKEISQYTSQIEKPIEYKDYSILQELSQIAEKYEQILSSFSGIVISIEENEIGEPTYALISVSVDGNNYIIKRFIRQIGFEVKPEMRIIVDCIERSGHKKLSFRKIKPIELDNETLELLKTI